MTHLKMSFSQQEDLPILATYLQDAIVSIKDITFLPHQRRFITITNRFKWEKLMDSMMDSTSSSSDSCDAKNDVGYERTHCGLTIEGVTAVRRRNLDLCDRKLLLSFLTIVPSESGLILIFAGESYLFLEALLWHGQLEDIGNPWPTSQIPRHEFHTGDE